MKLFHTSDWHLGKMLYGRNLLPDQRWFFERVFLPAAEREKPACVLLAGDIYDRQIAPPEAIQLFDFVLSRLTELGIRLCIISGNHDGADRIAILKTALRSSGVYFSTCLQDVLSPVLLEENGEKAQIFLLPYFNSAQGREFLQDDSLRGENACMRKILEMLPPLFEPGAAHILVSHCFAAGAERSDSESSLFVGGAGEIPPELFSAFDYVALGHLHAPQRAGERGRYSGSPLKYSVDEQNQKKGYCEVIWDGKTVSAKHIPVEPLHDVRRVSGLFQELLEQGKKASCEDYVELVLTDKSPVFQARDKLRPYYPNLLSVQNPWAIAGEAGQRAEKLRGQDDRTIFSSFLQDICGAAPEDGEMALFESVLGEVEP